MTTNNLPDAESFLKKNLSGHGVSLANASLLVYLIAQGNSFLDEYRDYQDAILANQNAIALCQQRVQKVLDEIELNTLVHPDTIIRMDKLRDEIDLVSPPDI